MFDAITSDLQSKDGTISISNFAGIDAFPLEGSTDSVSVFRAEPFLGLTNDDTADGTVVIFEGSSTDDSHTWQRSADAAGGCSADYFTITNKASGTLLTKISDTGNLLICAASTSTSTSTDCVSTILAGECDQTIHNLSNPGLLNPRFFNHELLTPQTTMGLKSPGLKCPDSNSLQDISTPDGHLNPRLFNHIGVWG